MTGSDWLVVLVMWHPYRILESMTAQYLNRKLFNTHTWVGRHWITTGKNKTNPNV